MSAKIDKNKAKQPEAKEPKSYVMLCVIICLFLVAMVLAVRLSSDLDRANKSMQLETPPAVPVNSTTSESK